MDTQMCDLFFASCKYLLYSLSLLVSGQEKEKLC